MLNRPSEIWVKTRIFSPPCPHLQSQHTLRCPSEWTGRCPQSQRLPTGSELSPLTVGRVSF